MSVPQVSVLMPVFDRLAYLPAAIESVLGQSFKDWELIIADDGSGPPTRAYLESLRSVPRVELRSLAHTGRPGAVRNVALQSARGQYVAFLDSDDCWAPRKLERQLTAFAHHPECGWSYTDFELIDARGARLSDRSGCSGRIASGWILDALLRDAVTIALPTVLVRRELIERLGGFDPTLRMSEDDDLWLRLAQHSEAVGLCAALTQVRRHAQHGGSDELAWRERRRVFERALRHTRDARQRALLQRMRAHLAAGLVRSQALACRPLPALATWLGSARYAWGHGGWWDAGLELLARCLLRGPLRRIRRELRWRPRPARP